jgi:hypothetical protein
MKSMTTAHNEYSTYVLIVSIDLERPCTITAIYGEGIVHR